MKNKKGFTLVEMLVVISIIGILSSFAVVSLNSARQKARDALRKGDMAQLRTALNLYYDDNNYEYPECGILDPGADDYGADVGSGADTGSTCYTTILSDALTSGSRPLMGRLPEEPKNPTNDADIDGVYIYRYVSDGEEYAIVYTLEEGGEQLMRGW